MEIIAMVTLSGDGVDTQVLEGQEPVRIGEYLRQGAQNLFRVVAQDAVMNPSDAMSPSNNGADFYVRAMVVETEDDITIKTEMGETGEGSRLNAMLNLADAMGHVGYRMISESVVKQ